MATVRCRLNQKNKDNSYSTVHLETEASLVLMSDGTTAQDKLESINNNPSSSIHASTHAIGGTDPLTAEAIGAAKASDVNPLIEELTELRDKVEDAINKVLTNIAGVPFPKNTLTYTGAEQSPEWNGFDETCMEISGDTVGTNAGEYTAIFTAKKGYQWSDGTAVKTVKWTIDRAVIAAIPSQSGSLTYNGGNQSPTWINYDSTKLTISGDTAKTNAGSYSAVFTPTENYKWSDNTTTGKTVAWSIGKAAGSVSLSSTSVSFTSAGGSKQITVNRAGTGTISASSSNSSVASCSVSENVVTITNGSSNGNCNININVAGDDNYNSASGSVSVVRNVYVCPAPATLGATFSWAGHSWIVVHVESDRIYAARTEIYETCVFSSDGSTAYSGSNLAARALAFQNSLPSNVLENAVNITVNGVTAKIFAASREQLNGGFSYFTDDTSRKCKYNGAADRYWTSSQYSSKYMYSVTRDGDITYGDYDPNICGFRPFVALKR